MCGIVWARRVRKYVAVYSGAYVNDFTRFSRQWKVSVQTAPEAGRNPENLF